MSFICHIHNYTEYNEEWNVFSAFNPSKCTHLEQWAADCAAPGEQSWTSCQSRDFYLHLARVIFLEPTVQRPGSSRGLPARAGIQTHNLGLPRVSSPTLYPLGQRLPLYSPKPIFTCIWHEWYFWSLIVCIRQGSFSAPCDRLSLRTLSAWGARKK